MPNVKPGRRRGRVVTPERPGRAQRRRGRPKVERTNDLHKDSTLPAGPRIGTAPNPGYFRTTRTTR